MIVLFPIPDWRLAAPEKPGALAPWILKLRRGRRRIRIGGLPVGLFGRPAAPAPPKSLAQQEFNLRVQAAKVIARPALQVVEDVLRQP